MRVIFLQRRQQQVSFLPRCPPRAVHHHEGAYRGKQKEKKSEREAKRGNYSLLPIGRQISSHLLRSRASVQVVVPSEDKLHNHKCPPSSSFPPPFIAKHDVIWSGISLWSVWVSCPGCVPSQSLAHPQPTGFRMGGGGDRKPWHCASTVQQ